MKKKKYTLKDIKKVKKNYKIFDYIFYTRVSSYITLILLRTKVTPNQVTLISLFFSIISSIFFLQGTYINIFFGAIFLQIAQICDAVDGEIARVKKITTKFGGFFDSAVNTLVYYLVVPSMAIGHYLTHNEPAILIFAIFALGNMFLISKLRYMFQSEVPDKKLGHQIHLTKRFIIGGFSTYAFLLGIGAILNLIYYTLLFIALAGALIWIRQMYSYYKICKE